MARPAGAPWWTSAAARAARWQRCAAPDVAPALALHETMAPTPIPAAAVKTRYPAFLTVSGRVCDAGTIVVGATELAGRPRLSTCTPVRFLKVAEHLTCNFGPWKHTAGRHWRSVSRSPFG